MRLYYLHSSSGQKIEAGFTGLKSRCWQKYPPSRGTAAEPTSSLDGFPGAAVWILGSGSFTVLKVHHCSPWLLLSSFLSESDFPDPLLQGLL